LEFNLKFLDKIKGYVGGPKEFVGLDIGSYSIKIVWLVSANKTFKLKGWGYVPLAIKEDLPPNEKKHIIAWKIKELFENKKILNRNVAMSISGNSVIVRYVNFPRVSMKELNKAIEFEAEPYIPFDIKDVNLGCCPLDKSATIKPNKKDKKTRGKWMEVVLVAAKKTLIKDKIDILEKIDLNPLVIDVDVFAVGTAAEKAGLLKDVPSALLLNIGHKVTNLAIVEKGVEKVSRDIFVAGSSFTNSVAEKLGVTTAEGEALKFKWGLNPDIFFHESLKRMEPHESVFEKSSPDESETPENRGEEKLAPPPASFEDLSKEPETAEKDNAETEEQKDKTMQASSETPQQEESSQKPEKEEKPQAMPKHTRTEEHDEVEVNKALQASVGDLISEVKRSIDFYLAQGTKNSISKVILSGGSARLKNLEKVLAKELGAPVEIFNPFEGVTKLPEENIPPGVAPSMAVATGLAFRKLWDC
jgi:type IV pilus assembly protein PilM